MKRVISPLTLLLFLACLPGAAGKKPKVDTSKLPAAATGRMDFGRDIRPILVRSCLKCHGPEKPRGGLRLDTREAALEGSDSGPVLKPGDAVNSRLLHVVAGLDPDTKMPPRGKPLTAAEVGRLRAWIDQGAKWPADAALKVAPRTRHWAFLPVRRPPVPRVSQAAWPRNAIDGFILARLEKEKIRPSPEADKVTLIRRLSLDLLGLPPTPREVEAFVRDGRPGAYERLVDRLLASPHYGERWGRHWLDLARYADSDGYEKDRERPHAWRYRHWVIAALNRDLPYDRFTVEQLAGDLLPTPPAPPSQGRESKISPPYEGGAGGVEQRVATGFHRNALHNDECGVDKEQFRVEKTVDRTNATATVFLGLTLACAQCHDHKYDPLSQREYYRFFAFFNSLEEKDIVAPLPGEGGPYRKAKAEFDKKKAELEGSLAEFKQKRLPLNQQRWEKELKRDEIKKLPANIRAILGVRPDKRSPKQQKALADYYATTDLQLEILTGILEDHLKTAPQVSMAQTLVEGKTRPTHVLLRGDFLKPGARVQAGVPAVLPPLPKGARGSRLDLAKWLVDPANPLTARVAVNRLWQHHFGRGLVHTSEDFGTQGEKPSHPELLDYLAGELVRRGWSFKAMHRLIVTSATYRQSSVVRDDLKDRDPQNILLARQSRLRLEAEVIRDVTLAAGGLLYRKIGGPSVRPPQPTGVAEITFLGDQHWVASTGPDRYRRGLYTFFRRTSPYPSLTTFDAPDANLSCTRRVRSNTPLQALVLLNDKLSVEAAQSLTLRVLREQRGNRAARVCHAFRVCLARKPSDREAKRLAELFDAQLKLCEEEPEDAAKLAGNGPKPPGVGTAELATWVATSRVLINLDEFITRE
jgi:hypothetical protein